jgi:hypothetical protein
MDQPRVLLTLIGYSDHVTESDEAGPVRSLLGEEEFLRVYLFYTGSRYLEQARTVELIAKQGGYLAGFHFVDVEPASSIDYEEVFHRMKRASEHLLERIGHLRPERRSITGADGSKKQAARLVGISGAAFRKARRTHSGQADARDE